MKPDLRMRPVKPVDEQSTNNATALMALLGVLLLLGWFALHLISTMNPPPAAPPAAEHRASVAPLTPSLVPSPIASSEPRDADHAPTIPGAPPAIRHGGMVPAH